MAKYLGTYQSDRGDRYPGALLSVGIGGSPSPEALDREVLPQIFFDRVIATPKGKGCASLPFSKRYARLMLSDGQWLNVPLPFMPGTTELNQFMIQAAASYSQIREIGIVGESIGDAWVNFQNGKKP